MNISVCVTNRVHDVLSDDITGSHVMRCTERYLDYLDVLSKKLSESPTPGWSSIEAQDLLAIRNCGKLAAYGDIIAAVPEATKRKVMVLSQSDLDIITLGIGDMFLHDRVEEGGA